MSNMTESPNGKAFVVLSDAEMAAGIKSLEYLDLVTKFKLAFAGNASLDNEIAFVNVPFGNRKLFNREILKALGPVNSMVLFPKFPLEVREKIYDYTVVGVTVEISLMDNSGKWCGDAFPPEALQAASKEALEYMMAKHGYMPVFKNGTTLYSPSLDGLVMRLVSRSMNPTLSIGPKFADSTTMGKVSSITFEVNNIKDAAQWIRKNLEGMTGLTSLAIHGFMPTLAADQSEVAFYIISTDHDGTRKEYEHEMQAQDSVLKFVNFNMLPEVGRLVTDQNEQQGVFELVMMLDRCLKNRNAFPTFPRTVVTALRWIDE